MDWSAFGPLILPYATTCSAPLMEQHARLAAIEFFEHTKAWQADLDAIVADGIETSFSMVPPDDAQIEKIIAVSVTDANGNVDHASVLRDDGRTTRRRSDLVAYTPDRIELVLQPLQRDGTSIVVTAALKPTLLAETLPDVLFNQYGQHIAQGALSSLTSMAAKPWTDATVARISAAKFINAKAVTARKVERGMAKSQRPPATRWF